MSRGLLILFAGGDPWKVNATLQSGKPTQIGDLAQAFHDAGNSSQEADRAFTEARDRLRHWTRDNGQHPINDAPEVQQTVAALGLQASQLPQIGADLESIAAALAQAQSTGNTAIADLESNLQMLDDAIGWAEDCIEQDEDLISKSDNQSDIDDLEDAITRLEDQITGWEKDALADTKEALKQLEKIRDDYSHDLEKAEAKLRADGYDPTRVWGIDGHQTETPATAEADVKSALTGNQGAAARVKSVLSSLTPDQLAGKAPLSPEQAAVLSQLQAQEHGMSMKQLKEAEERLGDERGLIGDSWQAMSNASLSFPKAGGTEQQQGGTGMLPDCIQEVLKAPGFIYADQTKVIADIAKDGNPALQRNTGLDQGLLRKSGELMNLGRAWDRGMFESQVRSALAVAGRDHAAVAGMLTQQGGSPSDASKNFLRNITHHAWADKGEVAGSLFSWTENAAKGPEAQIAGQTAHAYAAYLGQADDLLHLPGNHTIGELDPKLVQAMSHGLSPYVENIALTGGLPEFGDPLDSAEPPTRPEDGVLPHAKNIFSVLSTDQNASQYFTEKAYAAALQHEYAFANDPGHPNYSSQLYGAATLRGLVDVGTHNAWTANENNGYHQQLSAYQSNKLAYENSVQGLSAGVGLIPGGGKVVGPGITMLGRTLESDWLGPEPTAPGASSIHQMSVNTADREIVNAMLATQHPTGLPPAYIAHDAAHPNGRLATWDEVRRQIPDLTLGDYNQFIGNALTGSLGSREASGGVPDSYMAGRYDEIVGIPAEPPKRK